LSSRLTLLSLCSGGTVVVAIAVIKPVVNVDVD
jgi:hypothetical protein